MTFIDDLFFKAAELNYDKIALKYGDKDISYRSLTKLVNDYADWLSNSGVRNGSIVAVILPRTPEVVAVLLAILKLCAIFVPVDKNYPFALKQYMVSDSECRFLVTDSPEKYVCPKILLLNDLAELNQAKRLIIQNKRTASDPAYHIYTSGSTGNPKGVKIKHESVVNLINNAAPLTGMTFTRSIPFISSISFDMMVHELVISLCLGMTVFIATEHEIKNPRFLARLISRADTLLLTPSRFRQLLLVDKKGSFFKDKQYIYFGGEALSQDILLLCKDKSKAKIFNLYGPSETTLFAAYADLTYTNEISIGMPVSGVFLHILDDDLELADEGTMGQIAISGAGVGLGYANSPELSRKLFIENKNITEGAIFLTGDIGWKRSDGSYMYEGRKDSQVKYLGYRIELQEIESKANLFRNIDESICSIINELDNPILALFYTAEYNVNQNELRTYLSSQLPDYMIPSFYQKIKEIPITNNGKINRNGELLAKSIVKEKKMMAKEKYRKIVERLIVEICSESQDLITQGKEKLIDELGFDSIGIMRLIVMVEDRFNISFDDEMMLITSVNTVSSLTDLVYSLVGKQMKSSKYRG
ncbi:MAG: AMP-binding protein [Lachnospiraceae bacterium]|nr:AMP-binding protein [Lachnospiraceae bacterium]